MPFLFKTKVHDYALLNPEVIIDNTRIFRDNITRRPSEYLDFNTMLSYMASLFEMSNFTPQ
jgi:hypothetical protein